MNKVYALIFGTALAVSHSLASDIANHDNAAGYFSEISLSQEELASLSIASNNSSRPETGSFLNRPAASLADVVLQIKRDDVVADRFMRHFHMRRGEVAEYIGSLHISTLPKDGIYEVFNVHEDGVIRSRMLFLKKSTAVYSDVDGRPILKAKCANPMVFGRKPNEGSPMTGDDADVTGTAAEQQSMVVVARNQILEPAAPAPPESTPPKPNPIVEHHSRDNGLGFLGLIGLIGLTGRGGNHCPPVPEPASIFLLATGPALLYAARARRKKKFTVDI